MKTHQVLILATVGAALLAVAALAARPRPDAAAKPKLVQERSSSEEPIPQVNEQLAGELRKLSGTVSAPGLTGKPTAVATPHRTDPSGGGQTVDYLVEFDVAFGSDPADHSAGRAERRAAEAVRAALPPESELRSVECHTSMCRIETSHKNDKAVRDFATKLSSATENGFPDGATYSQRVNRGAPPGDPEVFVSYVAREGHELPRFE